MDWRSQLERFLKLTASQVLPSSTPFTTVEIWSPVGVTTTGADTEECNGNFSIDEARTSKQQQDQQEQANLLLGTGVRSCQDM